jgi:hypothetical protein
MSRKAVRGREVGSSFCLQNVRKHKALETSTGGIVSSRVPDEEGMHPGDRAAVGCSEVEGNHGPSITEAAEDIHESVTRSFRLE